MILAAMRRIGTKKNLTERLHTRALLHHAMRRICKKNLTELLNTRALLHHVHLSTEEQRS